MTQKQSRDKIYTFLYDKFGITRAENNAELQELKSLLQEYGQAVLENQTAFVIKKDAKIRNNLPNGEIKTAPKEERSFFAPKSFG